MCLLFNWYKSYDSLIHKIFDDRRYRFEYVGYSTSGYVISVDLLKEDMKIYNTNKLLVKIVVIYKDSLVWYSDKSKNICKRFMTLEGYNK